MNAQLKIDPLALKPVVMYSHSQCEIAKGESAWVLAIGHPKKGTKRIITSTVVEVGTFFTKIGPKFETLNTIYVPVDWLEPGALWEEREDKEHA